MTGLCFITTCMGRLAFLRQTLGAMAGQTDSSCVVVDYSCPEGCGAWVADAYPQVRVVREVGQTTFNLCRARNLGARAADAPWLCFCDADVLPVPSFAAAVAPLLAAGHYYRPDAQDDQGLWGTFLCARADFERVGGYDEVYQGWGEEEVDLYTALGLAGVRPGRFPAALLRHLPHGDAERVRYCDNKDHWFNGAINRLYRLIKFDLMRLRGKVVPREVREEVYRKVAQNLRAAVAAGKTLELGIDITAGEELAVGWKLDRTLTYRLRNG
jgi:glycosyltransferase involved in cell wall biosynthesis